MSNVVQLFGRKKPTQETIRKPLDILDLGSLIVNWAEEQGIDTENEGFIIRVSDLMAQLQIMAMDSRETA